jgi:hypothetical protein
MARLKGTKPSKNFVDRVSSLVPQQFSEPGTYKPTLPEARAGYESLLNNMYLKLLEQYAATRKIQPGVQNYEDFNQPGYSPDIEPYWDEDMKNEFRQVKKEYHKQRKK